MKNSWLPSKTTLICYTLLFTLFLNVTSHTTYAETPFEVQATAAIAIDAETGKIFYEKNAETPLPIASMTKLLTLYLVLEAEQSGLISWDEQIDISDHLLKISLDTTLSNVPFLKDQTYSVKDLFNASAIVSANAAVTALAERIAGTEKEFIDLMTQKVSSWGIEDAYLISTSGINNEDALGQTYPGSKKTDENLMSAKDIAIVAQHLIQDFPEFLDVSKEPYTLFAPGTDEERLMSNSNFMLPGYYYYKEGVDGLKTGTTELAGACFAGTIEQNGLRLITIVMNANNFDQDGGLRFVETSRLMDYVYDNWDLEILYPKGTQLSNYPEVAVDKGILFSLPVVTDADLYFWKRADMKPDYTVEKIENTYNVLNHEDALTAPVKKGTKVGDLVVSYPEDSLGYLDGSKQKTTVPLVTNDQTSKASFFVLSGRSIKHFFTNVF